MFLRFLVLVLRAALDCIACQIANIVEAMRSSSGMSMSELRVDGGSTRNKYLMQFQSDILNIKVRIPDSEELSGIGAAYAEVFANGSTRTALQFLRWPAYTTP